MPNHVISPRRWTPPPTMTFRPRSISAERVISVPGVGPEDVVVRPNGMVWTGLENGQIVSVDPQDGSVELVTNTGGRPLGLENHPDGGLVICDTERGLLHLDPAGSLTVLTDTVDGRRMIATNNAAVAKDGTIFFTDSSQHFEVPDFRGDLIEHDPTGRLLKRDPDGTVTVLMDDLSFANGVALLADESTVIVAETGGYVMRQLHLPTGETALFGPTLPGFPDNLSLGDDGLVWVALASPRNPMLDFLLPRAPILRRLLWALPQALQPQPASLIQVQGYDADGNLVHDLSGKHPQFGMATGVRQAGDRLWLGSLTSSTIASVRL